MTVPQRLPDVMFGAHPEPLGDLAIGTQPGEDFLSLFEGAARCIPIWKPLFAPETAPREAWHHTPGTGWTIHNYHAQIPLSLQLTPSVFSLARPNLLGSISHLVNLGLMDPLPAGTCFTVDCDLRLGVTGLPSLASFETLTLEE